MDKVFGNHLIVRRICSFSLVDSRNDLLRLRLLNRLFQEEATKELLASLSLNTIKLFWRERKESEMKEFLDLMKTRQIVLRLRPFFFFPVSSFTLHQTWDTGMIESFCRMTAGQIRRLEFTTKTNIIENVVRILSHNQRLVKIKCNYERGTLSPLTPEQLDRLPTTFHQLRDLSLEYEETVEVEVENELCPLFEVLIRRSPGLERVRVPFLNFNAHDRTWSPDIRILRLLVETHPKTLPLISISSPGAVQVCPNMPIELMELNFRFRKIDIRMHKSVAIDVGVGSMKRRVEAWIGSQSTTLTYLGLMSEETLPLLTLPPLPSLQTLEVEHVNSAEDSHLPIEALDPTRYPSLNMLCFMHPVDDAGRISTGRPMGSVRTLGVYFPRRFTNPSWKQTFPNLTHLHFQINTEPALRHHPIGSDEDVESSIAFILTHFPALVYLTLDPSPLYSCLWNVLTGATPPLPANSPQLYSQGVPTCPPEDPVNGIYQNPSLGNMRALKTLELCEIRNRGTLDAVLYMTCAGLLGPLDTLWLGIDEQLLLDGEQEDLHRHLTRIHKKVTLYVF